MTLPSRHRVRVEDSSGDPGVTAEERNQLLGPQKATLAWEYRVLSPATISDLEHQLNDLGAQGFEVVGVSTAFKQAHGREVPFLVLQRPRQR